MFSFSLPFTIAFMLYSLARKVRCGAMHKELASQAGSEGSISAKGSNFDGKVKFEKISYFPDFDDFKIISENRRKKLQKKKEKYITALSKRLSFLFLNEFFCDIIWP